MTSSTTPKRDKAKPYKFTTKGRVVPPSKFCAPGVLPTTAANCIPIKCLAGQKDPKYCTRPVIAAICSGKVNVRFQGKGATISSRNVSVKPDCTYVSKVTLSTKLRTRVGKLKVRSRFQGNAVLQSKSSGTTSVRAG